MRFPDSRVGELNICQSDTDGRPPNRSRRGPENWYAKLTDKELPRWNYRIHDYGDFLEAIDDHNGQIEAALRKRKNSGLKLRLSAFRSSIR